MMATAHMGPRYETMLAIHILSIALLLVWFPFSKLMHTFFFVVSRATTGGRFARRGSLA
jgi:nitrate reductase gamma subunit